MNTAIITRLSVLLVAAGLLAACGDDEETTLGNDDGSLEKIDPLLPARPEDKLVEETVPPERVLEDTTPEVGTSGEIPGRDPREAGETAPDAEPVLPPATDQD